MIISNVFFNPPFCSKNLFDLIPGLLFMALILMPESSAKQGMPNFLKPKVDFIIAFSLYELPTSLGSLNFGKSFKVNILSLL